MSTQTIPTGCGRNDDRATDPRGSATRLAFEHRSVWTNKLVLREVYRDVYRRIENLLAPIVGPTIELGAGPGSSQAYLRNVLCIDVVIVPWLDVVGDACSLPLADASAANLFMVDVLHHLAYPQRFFAEAARVLEPGGRLVIVDMWPSLASYPLLRWAHPEPLSLSVRPLDVAADRPLFDPDDPWSSDQGIARAIFWKQKGRFEQLFPALRVIRRSQFSTLLWPLSGGFDHKSRVPAFAAPWLQRFDQLLEPFARWLGFRSLIVLERC